MVSGSQNKISGYREEQRVRSSSVERFGKGADVTKRGDPDWNQHLDQLLEELQTSIHHRPSSGHMRSDGVSHHRSGSLPRGSLLSSPSSGGPAAALSSLFPIANGSLVLPALTDKDKITDHVKEEYTSPDQKTHTFKESYNFGGRSDGPGAVVTRHGNVSYYSSKYEDDGTGRRLRRTGSLRDRSPDRPLESSFVLREIQRDSGFDKFGGRDDGGSYAAGSPYSTVKSGYNSSTRWHNRTHSESGMDQPHSPELLQPGSSGNTKYWTSDTTYSSVARAPKRTSSLDRRPGNFSTYGSTSRHQYVDDGLWQPREGSLPRFGDSTNGTWSDSTRTNKQQYTYNYLLDGDRAENRGRSRDRSSSPPRTLERESRGRTRHHVHVHTSNRVGGGGGGGGMRDDGSPPSPSWRAGSESRSPSVSRRGNVRQRDASPVMPGYGTDADPSKLVTEYNYQYMQDGCTAGSRSPSPSSIRRYFSQRSIEEKNREPIQHKISYVRKEPERPPTPAADRVFPRNITSPDAGEQRPPKQVDDLMASLSRQKLHEYRKVDTSLKQQIRSSTPKPEKKVEIDETRIVVKHPDDDGDDEKKKLIAKSKAGPAVYYPPGFEQSMQKKDTGKVAWMSGEAEMARGSYKYKSGSKSSEKKVAVPICLPVCCAAPLCSVM